MLLRSTQQPRQPPLVRVSSARPQCALPAIAPIRGLAARSCEVRRSRATRDVTTGVEDRLCSKTQETCAHRAILAARLADTTTRIAIPVRKKRA
ncbi:hypothetical protein IG631_23279 [Alternaria alternata]|nr:hypothetical protein IG631_23279 [Alternaria alternata]